MDNLGEIPELDKTTPALVSIPPPEPLVVPDHPIRYQRCSGVGRKTGKECHFPTRIGSTFCKWHDPNTTKQEKYELSAVGARAHKGMEYRKVKSKREILKILSGRLDKFLASIGDQTSNEIEQTICYMARAYVTVLSCEENVEALKARGWSIPKKTGT